MCFSFWLFWKTYFLFKGTDPTKPTSLNILLLPFFHCRNIIMLYLVLTINILIRCGPQLKQGTLSGIFLKLQHFDSPWFHWDRVAIKRNSVVWEMTVWQRNVHNPEGNQKDRCCRLSELQLNMRTKGHELMRENSLALKSASNSFAIALCGINSPRKYNKQHTQQEGGQVALDTAMGNLMNRKSSVFYFQAK